MRKRIKIDLDIDALRAELKIYQNKLKIARDKVEEIKESYKNQIKVCEEEASKFDVEWQDVWKKIEATRKRANLTICNDYHGCRVPYYCVDSYSERLDTNIKPEVITAIKNVVGISKLKHSQVEDLARLLIVKHLARNKNYQQLIKRRTELRNDKQRAWNTGEKIRKDAKLYEAQCVVGTLAKRIHEIEHILSNPKKWKSNQEKEKLREWALSAEGIAEVDAELRKLRRGQK